MPQTFYIENDEEIISVIGRLRHSTVEENYFIFPKRSLVLQSIINLKLLQREAEKFGKKVVIVTQDETGIALAEKAGLATEHYTDDFARQTAHLELVPPVVPTVNTPKQVAPVKENIKSENLGSSDFYASDVNGIKSEPAFPPIGEERLLRIRNASPEKQTSLNSKRVATESTAAPVLPEMAFHPMVAPPAPAPVREAREISDVPRGVISGPRISATQNTGTLPGKREERLKNFFSNERKGSAAPQPPVAPRPPKSSLAPTVSVASHKVKSIFVILGGISLLSLLGVSVYLFLPRAEIRVVPYKTTQSVDLQFEGRFEGVIEGDDTLLVRLIEKEQAVVFSAEATGTSPGTAQKSRGNVTLYNKYSTDSQALVATTRLESPDGKVFRLVEGVTVPGMKNQTPGTVEAAVMADQTGSEYNIGETTFTIPGFKGSPKYEKFSAQSNKAMSGGGNATGNDERVISKDDLDKAKAIAEDRARQAFMDAVSSELAPGEMVLKENLDVFALDTLTLPFAGTAASSFEYKNTFRVRGFLFSEQVIKDKIVAKGEATIGGILFRPKTVTLSYGEATPDYEAKKVRLKVRAIVDSESVVDTDKLTQALLGKDSDAIQTALGSFPEIKKIEIVFKPQWFASSVPTTQNRVTVVVEPGSAQE